MNAYLRFWKNIFNYKDRTNLSAFLIPQALNIGLIILFMLLASMGENVVILTISKIIIGFIIITLIPEISLMVRRYRDSGTSLYYFLVIVIFMMFSIIFQDIKWFSYLGKLAHLVNLYFLFKPSKKDDN